MRGAKALRPLLCGLVALVWAQAALAAADRVALVIGNGAYQAVTPLDNPLNDAADIGATLEGLGFEVETVTDLDQVGMIRALGGFRARAAEAEIALIYYAGHGIEVEGQNYLIPVDARLATPDAVDFEALRLDTAVRAAEGAGRLSLVIVDACRNNPFAGAEGWAGDTRSLTRGLRPVEPRGDTLVAYAARDGTVAQDGDGRNSPYARALIDSLNEPGVEIGQVFRRVRDRVLASTGRRQEPFVYGSLSAEEIYLHPAVAVIDPAETEAQAWADASATGEADALRGFLDAYPDGRFAAAATRMLALLDRPAPTPAPAPAPAPARDPDLEAWSAASLAGDIASLQGYLDAFPDGRFAATARQMIDAATPEATPDLASLGLPEAVARRVAAIQDPVDLRDARIGDTALVALAGRYDPERADTAQPEAAEAFATVSALFDLKGESFFLPFGIGNFSSYDVKAGLAAARLTRLAQSADTDPLSFASVGVYGASDQTLMLHYLFDRRRCDLAVRLMADTTMGRLDTDTARRDALGRSLPWAAYLNCPPSQAGQVMRVVASLVPEPEALRTGYFRFGTRDLIDRLDGASDAPVAVYVPMPKLALSNSGAPDIRRDLQEELKRLRLYDARVDGVWGAGTARAVRTLCETRSAALLRSARSEAREVSDWTETVRGAPMTKIGYYHLTFARTAGGAPDTQRLTGVTTRFGVDLMRYSDGQVTWCALPTEDGKVLAEFDGDTMAVSYLPLWGPPFRLDTR